MMARSDSLDGNDENERQRRRRSSPMNQHRGSVSMTEEEERERRASIKEIMQDPDLTPLERRRSIQSLMDGRRRSSGGSRSITTNEINSMGTTNPVSMIAAAAAAAAEFYDSDDSDLAPPSSHLEEDLSETPSPSSPRTRVMSQRLSLKSFQRKGRSASLKEYASGTQAVAAAVAAAAAAAVAEFDDESEERIRSSEMMEKCRPSCDHYLRNCTIVSPCCGLAFGCRICHDDCPVLPSPDTKVSPSLWTDDNSRLLTKAEKRLSLPEDLEIKESHHTIDRFAIAEIICRHCYKRQKSKT
jgi:CHY zinc finger